MKFKFNEETYYTCVGHASYKPDHLWTCEYDEFTMKDLLMACNVLNSKDLKVKHILLGRHARSYFLVEKTLVHAIAFLYPDNEDKMGPEHVGCMLGWDIWSSSRSDKDFMQDQEIVLVTENDEGDIGDSVLIRLHKPDHRGMRPLVL